MSNEDNENNNEKKISQEFITAVKKYIEIDDILKDFREKLKKLNADKKTNEEFILDYLKSIDEKVIDVQDGKLRRNISKTQTPLKKELIQKALTDIMGDSIKAMSMTDHIIKSRPVVERVTLKRTKTRGGIQNKISD
jgi:hypothetical protein